jgi:hypothetical protein
VWPLGRFVALQSLCRAFVCGDTGPVHSAAASGTHARPDVAQSPRDVLPVPGVGRPRAYYSHAECSRATATSAGICAACALPPGRRVALLETMLDPPPAAAPMAARP